MTWEFERKYLSDKPSTILFEKKVDTSTMQALILNVEIEIL